MSEIESDIALFSFGRNRRGKKARMDPPSISAFRCQNNVKISLWLKGFIFTLKCPRSWMSSGWCWFLFFTTLSQTQIAHGVTWDFIFRPKENFLIGSNRNIAWCILSDSVLHYVCVNQDINHFNCDLSLAGAVRSLWKGSYTKNTNITLQKWVYTHLMAFLIWSTLFFYFAKRNTRRWRCFLSWRWFIVQKRQQLNSFRRKTMRNVLLPSARIVLCGSWKRGRVEKTQQAAL